MLYWLRNCSKNWLAIVEQHRFSSWQGTMCIVSLHLFSDLQPGSSRKCACNLGVRSAFHERACLPLKVLRGDMVKLWEAMLCMLGGTFSEWCSLPLEA